MSGPGVKPWMRNAPINNAATSSPGILRVNIGIMLEPQTALLADSAAAIPSTDPFPYFSGSLEVRFASP